MDPDTEAELLALRTELNALHLGQAWPKAIAVIALVAAVAALLFPAACR